MPPERWHFLRQDRDGGRSRKDGTHPATNLDGQKRVINDPRHADLGIYTEFCGCYCVDKNTVRVGGWVNPQ